MQFLLIDLMRERASGEEKMALLDRMQANAASADEQLRICFADLRSRGTGPDRACH